MKKVLLIYTGGTIGMVKDYQTDSLVPFNFEHIYNKLPEIKQLDCKIDTISYKDPIDSSNISPEDWVYLCEILRKNYADYDGFVVLHGTDTMSYTASALSLMIRGLQKPIIFTGSQLPIGDLRTDAKENLITSIYIASSKSKDNRPLAQEVMIYFEYKLYRANRTTKFSAEDFDAFLSPNYPCLIESGVKLKINNQVLWKNTKKPLDFLTTLTTNVAILKIFPGINPRIVSQILHTPAIRGIILESYGAGNAMTAKWFIDCLQDAILRNIRIVNVSQCLNGSVSQGKYQASGLLKKIGVISAADMTLESALAKMMLGLSLHKSYNAFQHYFQQSIAGEITPQEISKD